MMKILKEDVIEMTRIIARNISRKLKIEDPDFKSAPELIEAIKRLDSETYGLMDVFLNAYHEWYNFHKKVDQEGKAGNLSGTETEELANLIKTKDSARKNLMDKIDSMP